MNKLKQSKYLIYDNHFLLRSLVFCFPVRLSVFLFVCLSDYVFIVFLFIRLYISLSLHLFCLLSTQKKKITYTRVHTHTYIQRQIDRHLDRKIDSQTDTYK